MNWDIKMTMNWKTGGVLLGVVFFLAVLLVKPIGVSTEFVIADGVMWRAIDPSVVTVTADGATSTNAYLAKYAGHVADPLNYGVLFVISMMVGAGVSSYLRRGVTGAERGMPALWRANFGTNPVKRYAVAFLGGFIVLYGARLAGGCTSGHMMSGLMQTSLSAYIFTAGAFLAAMPVAKLLFKSEG